MIKYYLIIIVMTLIGSIASYFLKKSSTNLTIKNLLINKYIYIGGVLYVVSALLNIYVLKYLDYSKVLPLTSITYVGTFVISYYFLKERITKRKVLGVVLIVIGSVVLSL